MNAKTHIMSMETQFLSIVFKMSEVSHKLMEKGMEYGMQQNIVSKITPREGQVLFVISRLMVENPEGISLKLLTKNLNITQPATSMIVTSLVNSGFVRRQENPDDRRQMIITLADMGKAHLDAMLQGISKQEFKLIKILLTEEGEAFAKVLNKMHGMLCMGEE